MYVACYVYLVLCREFGVKVINLKVLMKAVPALFQHSDKNIRAEVSTIPLASFQGWYKEYCTFGTI